MVRKLRSQLIETAGIQSISADGLSTTFATGANSSTQAQLKYWEKQVLKLSGSRPTNVSMDLTGGL